MKLFLLLFLSIILSSFSYSQIEKLDSIEFSTNYSHYITDFIETKNSVWNGVVINDYNPISLNVKKSQIFRIDKSSFIIVDTVLTDTNFFGLQLLSGTDSSLNYIYSRKPDSTLVIGNWTKNSGTNTIITSFKGHLADGVGTQVFDSIVYFASVQDDSIRLFNYDNNAIQLITNVEDLAQKLLLSDCYPSISISDSLYSITCRRTSQVHLINRNSLTSSIRNPYNAPPLSDGTHFLIKDSIYHGYSFSSGPPNFSLDVNIFSSVSNTNFGGIKVYDCTGNDDEIWPLTRNYLSNGGAFFAVRSLDFQSSNDFYIPVLGFFSPEKDSIVEVWKGHKQLKRFIPINFKVQDKDSHLFGIMYENLSGNPVYKLYKLGKEDMSIEEEILSVEWSVFNDVLTFNGEIDNSESEISIMDFSGRIIDFKKLQRLEDYAYRFKKTGVYVFLIKNAFGIKTGKIFVKVD